MNVDGENGPPCCPEATMLVEGVTCSADNLEAELAVCSVDVVVAELAVCSVED